MTDSVLYETGAGVGQIVMNRPEASNAFDLAMAEAMAAAVQRAAEDPEVRVVLLRGAGQRFSAGGDLEAMGAATDRPAFIRQLAGAAHRAVIGLQTIDKPVLAAVQGAAAGIGLSLVLGADLVIAGRSAKFVTAYTSVGLTPDGGMSWLLPRVVGQRRAVELLLTSEPIGADDALALGIVSEISKDDALLVAALQSAATLTKQPMHALGRARRLVRESYSRTLEEHLEVEANSIAEASATSETGALIERFVRRS